MASETAFHRTGATDADEAVLELGDGRRVDPDAGQRIDAVNGLDVIDILEREVLLVAGHAARSAE